MSVSEQQTDLDAVVDELREFETGDTVTLVTDAGSITARVTDTRWDADATTVTFEDCEADRGVRVVTEWYGGWLDPLVDVYPADAHADVDVDADDSNPNPDPGLLHPVGTLVDVRLVTTADRHGRYGRP